MSQVSDYDSFRPTMNREEVVDWFTKRLNRPPEAQDYYRVAKDFYSLGAYSRALLCLQIYVTMPSAVVAGRHLLAYCYLQLGEQERSLREFKRCAKDGYHEDWQMVVELTIEDEQRRSMGNEEM